MTSYSFSIWVKFEKLPIELKDNLMYILEFDGNTESSFTVTAAPNGVIQLYPNDGKSIVMQGDIRKG